MSVPSSASPAPVTLSSTPILTRALKLAALLTVVLIVAGAFTGYALDAWVGVTSAVIGAALAFVFLAITGASILIANRSYASPLFTVMFFAIVLGAWIVKFVLFLTVALLLRDQPWINRVILFGFLVIGIIGTLIVDVVVVAKTRMPYVSDLPTTGRRPVLPGVEISGADGANVTPDPQNRRHNADDDSSEGPKA